MIVVCDASPVIALAAIGRLELLPALYGEVVLPHAVRDEITADPQGEALLADAPWMLFRAATDRAAVARLEVEVDRGEAEAIALAVELAADLVVVDDRRGRIVASGRGLAVIGVVGVILEARHRGLVAALRPVLDDLDRLAGFWLSDRVRMVALESAGEHAADDPPDGSR